MMPSKINFTKQWATVDRNAPNNGNQKAINHKSGLLLTTPIRIIIKKERSNHVKIRLNFIEKAKNDFNLNF
jgi:hypothetical protein